MHHTLRMKGFKRLGRVVVALAVMSPLISVTLGGPVANATILPSFCTVWAPPMLVPESVTVGGVSTEVIGNLGYNPQAAIQNGIYVGYTEERAAVLAGASFTGEGIDSFYLSAILDGSGVGLQQHVSAVQQGQFAALYQNLGIIPTWTNDTVSIPQGVTTLIKAGAWPLAIENYLVQLGAFSWTAVQAQAAQNFPIQKAVMPVWTPAACPVLLPPM